MKYSPKKTFSIAGLALFAAVAGSAVFSMLILTPLFMANDGAFMKKLVEGGYASLMVLFTYVPQLLALLIFWLIIRLIPKGESGSSQFSFGWLFQVFLMGYGVSTVLNVIGTMLNKSTGGTDFVGEISSMISTGLVVTFLIPVVIGPILEELIFRKLLIDRIRRFGEWNAVLFSALAFGLFHMNLPQFCYAASVGLMLGYVYVKTGRILYTIIMHILLNSASSLIVLATTGGSVKASIILLSAAAILIIVGVISGIILFFVKRKKLQFDSDMPEAISRDEVFRTAYLNPGVILYYAYCILMIVLALLNINLVG